MTRVAGETAGRRWVGGHWSHVPFGCSVQSGGDWTPHYNNQKAQPSSTHYQLVCSGDQPAPAMPWQSPTVHTFPGCTSNWFCDSAAHCCVKYFSKTGSALVRAPTECPLTPTPRPAAGLPSSDSGGSRSQVFTAQWSHLQDRQHVLQVEIGLQRLPASYARPTPRLYCALRSGNLRHRRPRSIRLAGLPEPGRVPWGQLLRELPHKWVRRRAQLLLPFGAVRRAHGRALCWAHCAPTLDAQVR